MFEIYEAMGFKFGEYRGRHFVMNLSEMKEIHGEEICYEVVKKCYEFRKGSE